MTVFGKVLGKGVIVGKASHSVLSFCRPYHPVAPCPAPAVDCRRLDPETIQTPLGRGQGLSGKALGLTWVCSRFARQHCARDSRSTAGLS
jgi:hypothetical protein